MGALPSYTYSAGAASKCSLGEGSWPKSGDQRGCGDGWGVRCSALRALSRLRTVCERVRPPANCGEGWATSSGLYGDGSKLGSTAMDRRSGWSSDKQLFYLMRASTGVILTTGVASAEVLGALRGGVGTPPGSSRAAQWEICEGAG